METLDNNLDQYNPKERDGCVTTWLVFIIITNSLAAMLYLFAGDSIVEAFPDEVDPTIILPLLALFAIGNVLSAFLLLKWKKAGFWGFLGTSTGSLFINLSIGADLVQTIAGLVGVVLFYGILQIKKNGVSAWNHLS